MKCPSQKSSVVRCRPLTGRFQFAHALDGDVDVEGGLAAGDRAAFEEGLAVAATTVAATLPSRPVLGLTLSRGERPAVQVSRLYTERPAASSGSS